MNKKIIGFLVVTLLTVTAFSSIGIIGKRLYEQGENKAFILLESFGDGHFCRCDDNTTSSEIVANDEFNNKMNGTETRIFNGKIEKEIFKEIEETENKILKVDRIIGERYVKYWEHEVNGFQIKGDYILLHKDINTDKIIEYKRIWTDINLSYLENNKFETENYFWEKRLVFPDRNDTNEFYTFYDTIDYPINCWEVRHDDGTTILYDLNGSEIGYGIPAPSEKGFAMSGDCNGGSDCRSAWRRNAEKYFNHWCTSVVSKGLPTPHEISSYVQDPDVTFFYELSHGNSTGFQADKKGSYYSSYRLRNDMANRQPMKFAFIGSCEGMRNTGPGTFSYEFRKGHTNGTVTVGYVGMSACPGWSVSLEWQNSMFYKMSRGKTVRKAFYEACAYYPTIANCVKFVGDPNLKVKNNPPSPPEKPSGNSLGIPNASYFYSTTTFDPDRDSIYFLFNWGDNTSSEWIGPYLSGETEADSHTWTTQGTYTIRVKAKDINGLESEWSDPLTVVIYSGVNQPPNKPSIPAGSTSGKPGTPYTYTTSTIDLDGDQIYYEFVWGDGTTSNWLGPYASDELCEAFNTWSKIGNYEIKVRARDTKLAYSEWSDPLAVSMPRNKIVTNSLFQWFLEQFPILQNF